MRVQSAVNVDDLTRNVRALVGSKVYAHIPDVFGATVAVDHDIAREDIFEHLRNVSVVFRRDDQSGAHAVATDILFAVLQRGILRELVHAGFGTGVSSGA